MNMRLRTAFSIPFCLLACTALPLPASAQGNYKIQVFPYETVAPRQTMVELHSNFTFQGSKSTDDGTLPTNHQLHETIEITHDFTDWFETGFYIFSSAKSGQGWDYVGSHIRPRARVPPKWHWSVGISLSNEIGWQSCNTPRTPGCGRSARSLISSSGGGISPSIPHLTGPFMVRA